MPAERDHADQVGEAAEAPAELADDLLTTAFRAVLGSVGLILTAVAAAMGRAAGAGSKTSEAPADGDMEPAGPPPLLWLFPAAALGVGLELGRRAIDAARTIGDRLAPAAEIAGSFPPVRLARESLGTWLEEWDRRGRDGQAANEALAARVVEGALPGIVDAVLDRVDLNAVLDRVDLDAVLARVDLNAVLARVDLQPVIDRIEVQAIVDRVDLDVVAARIDIAAIVDRLDVGAIAQGVLDELDLAAIAQGVIDELELGEIIRESTGTVTVEAVDALRVGGMNADRFVARVVDRMLMRRRGRRLEVGESNGNGALPAPSDTVTAPSTGNGRRRASPGPTDDPGVEVVVAEIEVIEVEATSTTAPGEPPDGA